MLTEAVGILDGLRAQGDTSEITAIGLGLGLAAQARTADSLNQDGTAEKLATRAVTILEPLMAAPSPSVPLRRAYGNVKIYQGFSQMRGSEYEASVKSLDRARESFRSIDGLAYDDLPSAAAYAEATGWRMEALRALGRVDEAKSSGEDATEVATKVLAKRPAYMGALRARALVTSNLADIESDDLHLAKALPLSQGSTRDWESFLQLDPGNTIALNNLAAGYQREGWFLFRTGRVAEAIESYTAATAVEKRTRMSPSFAINQMWPAGSVVFVEADRGNYAQAEAALAHVRQLSAIAGEPRKDASSQATLRMFEANFAAAIPVAKWDFAAARKLVEGALPDTSVPPPPGGRVLSAWYGNLNGRYRDLANAAFLLGDYPAAEAALTKSMTYQQQIPDRTLDRQRDVAQSQILLAMILARQGKSADAQQAAAPALKLHRELHARKDNEDLDSTHRARAGAAGLGHGGRRQGGRIARGGRGACRRAAAEPAAAAQHAALAQVDRRGTGRTAQTGLSDTATAIREALNAGLNVQALDLARGAAAGDAADPPRSTTSLRWRRRAWARSARRKSGWRKSTAHSLGASPLAVEVWSLAGRIAKDRFAASTDRTSAAAQDFARKAIQDYERAYALGGGAYPAVNAATMAMLAGDSPRATRLAQQALSTLGTGGDHWHHATAGEALLVLDRIDEARVHYAEAYRLAGHRFGDIASMRRQLLLIGTQAARTLAETLPAPQVIAFSGHMIDHPERPLPRFPAHIEASVAAALRETVASLGPSLGYAQAACGADILFLEAMQDAGMQTQIVLPFPAAEFVRSSVEFTGQQWVARFERALARATRVVLATEEGFLGDDVLFEHAANLIQGMAYLRAMELSAHPLMLTVLERGAAEAVGGTQATARSWLRKGGRIENIDIAALRGDAQQLPPAPQANAAPQETTSARPRRMLASLLFADVSGFSRMPEQYAPRFAELFLGTCRRVLDSLPYQSIHANTHGDGLFLVFDLPSQAAEFALRLQHEIGQFDWLALGLAPETGVRIALHTGPIFRIFDPVTARHTFYGTHVNRAARLEPVVQPRQIFVTEEFAASLVAEDQQRFTCDYIGTMQLAKKFGDARLYRLRLAINA